VLRTVPTTTPVSYPIAVVKSSQEQAEAARFVQYVRSAAGQAVLKQYGFAAAH
jgi:molybdate transport system substrate-binding protein